MHCVLVSYLTNSGYRILSGFDHKTMSLMVALEEQSPDIASGVWQEKDSDDTGAGDQVGGGGQSWRNSYSNMQYAWKHSGELSCILVQFTLTILARLYS